MKLLIWGIVALAVVLIAGFGIFSWLKQQPMYRVGQAANLSLGPITEAEGEQWQVTQDIAINHFATGAGRNALYVHGGPGIPVAESSPALDLLGDSFRVHYFDQRGAGGSTRPFNDIKWEGSAWQNIQTLEGALGIAEQLADIERIRRILGDDKLVLIGHSYGGLLAALYAAEFPQNVEKLILIAPANLLVFPSPHGDLYSSVREALPDSEHQAYDAWTAEFLNFDTIFSKSTEELEELDGQFIGYFETASEGLPKASENSMGVWHARAQYFGLGQKHDWREAISAYAGPALVIHGEDDLQTLAVSHLYADSLAGAQVKTIREAAHSPHYSQPEASAQVMREFLNGDD